MQLVRLFKGTLLLFIFTTQSSASCNPRNFKASFGDDVVRLTKLSIASYSLLNLVQSPDSATAVASPLNDLREAISSAASKVPGYGESDVYYPNSWLGSWRTTRTITDITSSRDVPTPHFIEGLRVGDQFSYVTSYIPYKDHVVRDRTRRSHLSEYSPKQSVIFWEPGNPNSLEIRFEDRSIINIQTTKRSTERDSTSDQFLGYSEFFRIVNSVGSSVPQLYAGRFLTRYKALSADEIAGLERLYVYPSDSLDLSRDSSRALFVVKSQLVMLKDNIPQ